MVEYIVNILLQYPRVIDDMYRIKLYKTQLKSRTSEDLKLTTISARLLCVESPARCQNVFTLAGHSLLPL